MQLLKLNEKYKYQSMQTTCKAYAERALGQEVESGGRITAIQSWDQGLRSF